MDIIGGMSRFVCLVVFFCFLASAGVFAETAGNEYPEGCLACGKTAGELSEMGLSDQEIKKEFRKKFIFLRKSREKNLKEQKKERESRKRSPKIEEALNKQRENE